MPVRIRLARHGQRHNPFYHLVVIPSTKARDARPIEKLGEYDPIPRLPSTADLPSSSMIFGKKTEAAPKEKKVTWNVERIRYWLDTGAQPTRSVVKLLERGGVLTVPHKWQHQWSPGLAQAIAQSSATSSATSSPSASRSSQTSSSQLESSTSTGIDSPAGRTTGFAGATAT